MWILKWLPFWIFYALLFLGLIGLAATYLMRFLPIPALFIYKTPIQLISVVLIVIGTFMTGAIWNEEAWLQKVKELEAKVAESEAKASKANVDIQEKIVYKDKVIVQKGEEIIKYVDKFVTKEVLKEVQGPERVKIEEVIKYVENCPVPQEIVDIHNQAAKLNKK